MFQNKLRKSILYIWQLPQNLIALLFLLYLQNEQKHELKGIKFYYSEKFPGGISLGEYIIVGTENYSTVKHEYGHVLQSRILGPLYLFVIGIPSLLHAGLHNCENFDKRYFHFYTERWADKLGRIERNDKGIAIKIVAN